MKRRRFDIVSVLFLICFSVYAASPLSYAYEPGHDLNRTNAFNSPRLLILELFLSKLASHKQDAKDASHSHVNFILVKKRATISEDKLKISKTQLKKVVTVSDSAVLHRRYPLTTPAQDDEAKFPGKLHQAYSGLSPPSA